MVPEINAANGACHCGAVRFYVRLPQGLSSARRCNCSYCRMRGAIAITAMLEDFTLQGGEGALRLYQFNSGTAKHWFCGVCGIYTHHQRRSNPNEYGVNAACLEGVSPFDFVEIPVTDGVNHQADRTQADRTQANRTQANSTQAGKARLVGILRFTAS